MSGLSSKAYLRGRLTCSAKVALAVRRVKGCEIGCGVREAKPTPGITASEWVVALRSDASQQPNHAAEHRHFFTANRLHRLVLGLQADVI